jgi:hypothetical protein
MHRVEAVRRPTNWQPDLSIRPEVLDETIELLLSTRSGGAVDWLTVSFDDGYVDSAEYIESRARRFPQVEFAFFVCPEKLETEVGFRWDLIEQELNHGRPIDEARALLREPVPAGGENSREDLRRLAARAEYRLATVEKVRELRTFQNVRIGNHTNSHLRLSDVSLDAAENEIVQSVQTFERLFGPHDQFAFPFGTPNVHFDGRHVAMVRRRGSFVIWSTEARPFLPSERKPGHVLPRYPVDGTMSAKEILGWVGARALNHRLRGSKFSFS